MPSISHCLNPNPSSDCVAASADEAGYLELNTQFEVTGLRDRFPARDMPYPVYFRMNSFGGI